MSKRKGKTKWLSPEAQAEAEQRRSASTESVVAELRLVYSDLFDDSVIRMVAQQSEFDVDLSIATLSAMVDDPALIVAARTNNSGRRMEAQHSVQPPLSAGAWKVQPSVVASSTASSPVPRRPLSSQAQPSTSSLSSWPSPAETQPLKSGQRPQTISGRSLKAGDAPHLSLSPRDIDRWSPPSPASVQSTSPSPNPLPPTIRSAPSSPSSALPSPALLRGVSASTSSASPSSDASDPSLTISVHSPPSSLPAAHTAVSVVVDGTSQSFFDTRHGRVAASSTPLHQPRWSTYSATEEDPLYYLLMVREQHDKLIADKEEKRTEDAVEGTASVEEQLDAFPSLSLQSQQTPTSETHRMRVNAAELLDLLRTMFDGVDDALIQSVVASLDCLSVDLHQLNECVSTLSSIATNDQEVVDSEVEPLDPLPSDPPLGREHSNGHLSDLDIAKRMASDPRYSPPRASSVRSLTPSTSLPSSPSLSPAMGKRPVKVKVDLTKPVYKWQPTSSTDSLVSPHLSAKWSLDALYKAFPRIDRPLIDDCFAGHQCNWQKTREQLLTLFPGEMVGGDVAPLPPLLKVENRGRRVGEPPRPHSAEADGSDDAMEVEGLIPDSTLERELGPVLDNHSIPPNSSFVSASSHSTHANRRAAFFRAATAAFMVGKGGLAREYAKRGHVEGGLMVEVGVRGAMEVFREMNRDGDCYKRIDLHGLRVKEALCILGFVVRRLKRKGVGDVLVVTGRGRNSAGGRSRLKPAVLQFCAKRRLITSLYNDAEIKVSWR